ncbi:MAG: hypothetical protein ACTSXD_11980 [Candidatus Heimdallarchaeaceae archaeon]
MVRENRIKQIVIYPNTAVTGSNIPVTYSDNPINGEILKIRCEGIATPGSIWIGYSGTNIELWRKNDLTSGLNDFESYPFVYGVDNTDTTGSPHSCMNYVVNNHIFIAGSGMTSGTGTTFGPVTVFYR